MAGPEKVNIDELMKIAKSMFESVDPAFKELSDEERNDIENIMKIRISDVIQMSNSVNSVGDPSTMSDTTLTETMKALLPDEDEDEKSSGNDDQQDSAMDNSTSEETSENRSK
ncbi:uncharacterized protein LOC134252822 [Saccostrea cucullata]|uniref:uncharacterized protein LOC134252822 n=1 Tax=Saccostrea cuccullata TaxID=36930 RepID=UPI002ED1C027